MNPDFLLKVESDTLYFTGNIKLKIKQPIPIYRGITVVSGDNGSGKTTFAKILAKGHNFRTNKITHHFKEYPKIKYLEFSDIHSLAGAKVEYYQQRYEATMNDEVPEVREILGEKCNLIQFKHLCENFKLYNIENKKINYLSSGELRKLLIINALLESPDLLILDNPYIGLDTDSKIILDEALENLKKLGKSVMLLIANSKDIPPFTENIIYTEKGHISLTPQDSIITEYKTSFPFFEKKKFDEVGELVTLNDAKINYGKVTVIENLTWTVCSGERWSLTGPNGSGKSTLLSIINADNPKGYCHNLYLFGKKRGSGESIWDIKKHIGYVSPEMQLHFHGSGTVLQILANGFNDTVGLYVKPTEQQIKIAENWLKHFNLWEHKDKSFSTLSSGERQLLLVARAMIKQPRLLILDEPMHGLDEKNILLVQNTIEKFLEIHPESAFIMVTHVKENLPKIINRHLKLKGSFSTTTQSK